MKFIKTIDKIMKEEAKARKRALREQEKAEARAEREREKRAKELLREEKRQKLVSEREKMQQFIKNINFEKDEALERWEERKNIRLEFLNKKY